MDASEVLSSCLLPSTIRISLAVYAALGCYVSEMTSLKRQSDSRKRQIRLDWASGGLSDGHSFCPSESECFRHDLHEDCRRSLPQQAGTVCLEPKLPTQGRVVLGIVIIILDNLRIEPRLDPS